MRTFFAAVLLALAMGVAGCGSTNTAQTVPAGSGAGTATVGPPAATTTGAPRRIYTYTGSGTSPVTTSPATITTTSITTPSAPSSGGAGLTTATTAAAGTSACVAADLSLAAVGPNSAPGTAVLGFTLKNTSAHSCHTGGWPGVALYAAGAAEPLTTSATRSVSDVLGSTPEAELVLTPGQEASFRLVLRADSSDDVGCHTATEAQFIAPNDTTPMRVAIPDGAEYCGTATISPLQPGATGTGQ